MPVSASLFVFCIPSVCQHQSTTGKSPLNGGIVLTENSQLTKRSEQCVCNTATAGASALIISPSHHSGNLEPADRRADFSVARMSIPLLLVLRSGPSPYNYGAIDNTAYL